MLLYKNMHSNCTQTLTCCCRRRLRRIVFRSIVRLNWDSRPKTGISLPLLLLFSSVFLPHVVWMASRSKNQSAQANVRRVLTLCVCTPAFSELLERKEVGEVGTQTEERRTRLRRRLCHPEVSLLHPKSGTLSFCSLYTPFTPSSHTLNTLFRDQSLLLPRIFSLNYIKITRVLKNV